MEITYDADALSCEEADVVVSDKVDLYSVNVTDGSVKIAYLAEDPVKKGTLLTVSFTVADDYASQKVTATVTGTAHDKKGNDLSLGEEKSNGNGGSNKPGNGNGGNNGNNGNHGGNGNGNNNGNNNGNQGNNGKPGHGHVTIKKGQHNGWNNAVSQLESIEKKGVLDITLSDVTTVAQEFLMALKGQDKTVVFELDNGIKWSINGMSINGDISDIDFDVVIGADTIPDSALNEIVKGRDVVEISLAYDGEFGCEAVMSINLGTEHAGEYANLYYYNPQTGKMEFMTAGQIDESGYAPLTFTHASDYAIVLDTVPVKAVGTGDNANITMGVLILCVGLMVVAFAFKKKKAR